MKRTPLAALLAAFASLCAAAALPLPKSSPQALANGQRIFAQYCAACHDIHGTTAKSGPQLKNYYRQHIPHPTDADVRSVIMQGKGSMPAFSTLAKSQTDDLIAYLKTL